MEWFLLTCTKIDADDDIFTNGDIPSEHKVNKALSRMTLGRQIQLWEIEMN